MEPDDRDADEQWRNEYEEWAAEQEARDLDTLNRLMRAAREETIYDPREYDEHK